MRRVGERVFMELIWPDGYAPGLATAKRLEAALIDRFGNSALPHEGKLYFQNPWPRIADAEKVRVLKARKLLDPEGAFTSRYMQTYLVGGDMAEFMHTA